ncbi:MAG: hypothetical protein Q8N90_04315 [bacterium]|nr:hypothetical protein [bacterium]
MLCLASLIVFAILGIFSVAYRELAKEALGCVLRRVSFRPCESRFDLKVKAQITSSLMKRSEKVGQFFWKYFEAFSWVFIVLFIVSTFFTGRAFYNLIRYKTCDPQNPQNCFITSGPGLSPIPTECPISQLQNL